MVIPPPKSDGEIEVNFSNELPLESELKYFISNMYMVVN